MLYACAARFDVMRNLEFFWKLNKASHELFFAFFFPLIELVRAGEAGFFNFIYSN